MDAGTPVLLCHETIGCLRLGMQWKFIRMLVCPAQEIVWYCRVIGHSCDCMANIIVTGMFRLYVQVVKANMRRDREAQAKMFKGAFGSPGERRDKGLWEDGRSSTDINGSGKVSTLGWLWGLLLGWLGLLFGLKSLRR